MADIGAPPAEIDFANDDAALEAAYAAHGTTIHSFCARAVGPERPADVTQEVFLTAWRRRDRFDPERGSLVGWLVGIAKNKVRDAHRSHARYRALEDRAAEVADVVDLVGEPRAIDTIADRLLVEEAMSGLSERARRAVELSFWSELSHSEIADECGLPLGTVKSDIRRSLARLRTHLAGQETADA